MPNKKKGVNSGRAFMVLEDELKIKGGGIYCLMPFNTLDKKGKAVFKIGLAINFNSRMKQYHTYFPEGVYYEAFLVDPPVRGTNTRSMKKMVTKGMKFIEIEKFIIKEILAHKGTKRFHSTTHSTVRNKKEEGATEWVYCDEQSIHEAFLAAEKKFGGKSHLFYLEGYNPDTNEFSSINDKAKEEEKANPMYVGKIIFHQ